MHRILFVCHGNICRSPMAECVMKDLVARKGLEGNFWINSAATSTEEIGNPIHQGTRQKLAEAGVPVCRHRAVRMEKADYACYDLILGMDGANIRNIFCILGDDPEGKVKRLLDFSARPRDIADPWYTGNFDATYDDIVEGCTALLAALRE
ncbi:MAG: low molecular weight protein-tyrosine-phosphatase [Oscillibacter sp.]|nr:low molecular weight protein-tyrosine-phosphatase [Oscillibacter sp.]